MATVTEIIEHSVNLQYSTTEYLVNSVCFVVALTGLLLNGMMLIAATIYEVSDNPPRAILLLLLCVSDMGYCLINVIFIGTNLLAGGWFTGAIGCYVNGLLLLFTVSLSVCTILLLNVEFYVSVRFGYTVSKQVVIICIVCEVLYAISILVMTFYGASPEAMALEPGKILCITNWQIENSVAVTMFLYISVISIICEAIASLSMHLDLIAFYKKMPKRTNKIQYALMLKASIITVTYFICWVPYLTKIIYAMTTHRSIGFTETVISTVFLELKAVLNPCILIAFDARLRASIYSLIGRKVGGLTHASTVLELQVNDTREEGEDTKPLILD